MLRAWGVYRELAHSPGRETDDALILRETAGALAARGYSVELKSAEDLPENFAAGGAPPFLFVMCERVPTVEKLAAWEARGARIVNRPEAIRNTDRERTLARFAAETVAFPTSVLVSTAGAPDVAVGAPCWVKRGDVHATEAEDVVFAPTAADRDAALARLGVRGITRAVVQQHVPGDLIKFYGVAGEPGGDALAWFEWFYHRDQKVAGHAFDAAALRALVTRAAAALGLEVFGGDAIAGPGGTLVLIDLNAWPSFALYRAAAARHIAACLAARFTPAAVTAAGRNRR
jgi:hypothetical protein